MAAGVDPLCSPPPRAAPRPPRPPIFRSYEKRRDLDRPRGTAFSTVSRAAHAHGTPGIRAGESAHDVVVLLPALNEEEGVGAVIDEIRSVDFRRVGCTVRVWVVDGKSTDRTTAVARDRGASVFVQWGEGKGSGVRQALNLLMRQNHDAASRGRVFVMMDSDGTYPAGMLPQFIAALDEGWDVVVGSRFRGHIEDGAVSSLNRVGNWLLSRLAGLLYGVRVSDVCTGMWAFREESLRRLGVVARGFDIEADLFAALCEAGARLKELPIDYRRRIGEPKLVPIRAGLQIAWRLLLRRLTRDDGGTAMPRRVRTPATEDAV